MEADASRATRAALARPSDGRALDESTRQLLESSLGHDFAQVRVHHDAESDALATSLDARAFANGPHIYFRGGTYEPHTSAGLQVLAHEAAHVAQQARGEVDATTTERGVAENDAEETERAAHEAAGDVVRATGPAHESSVSSAPTSNAVVQRWPWDDDAPAAAATSTASAPSSGGLLDGVLSAGSGALDSLAGGAKAAYGAADSAGRSIMGAEKAVGGAAADAWNFVDSNYSAKTSNVSQLQQQMNGGVNEKGEKQEGWVDQAENWLKKGNNQVLASKDDSALGYLEKAGAWMGNTAIDATGGVVKGGMDLASMGYNAITHPIDSAVGMAGGMLSMAEHVPLVPGMNTMAKGLHGAYDIATGNEKGQYGKDWGELGSHLFDPAVSGKDDLTFAAGFGGGMQAWSDKPGEAATRTITNLLPMFLGAEGAVGDAAAVGEAAEEASVAGRGPKPAAVPEGTTPLDLENMFPEQVKRTREIQEAQRRTARTPAPLPEGPGGISGALGDVADWAGEKYQGIKDFFKGDDSPPPGGGTKIKNVHLKPEDIQRRRNKGV